jgi:hypothetical protein
MDGKLEAWTASWRRNRRIKPHGQTRRGNAAGAL